MPSQARKITFDTAAIFFAKIVSLLLGLVRLKYIAIYLGVNTFGVYTFAAYFVAMFGIVFDVGITQIITRDIAVDHSRSQELVGNSLILKGLLFVGTAMIITFATMASHFDNVTNIAVIFSTYIAGVNALTLVFTSAFQAHRRMRLVSIITIAMDLSTSIAVIVLLILGYGLLGLLAGSSLASTMILVIALVVYKQICGPPHFMPKRNLWRYLLREGYPVAIGSLGYVLFMYLTSALLKYLKGNEIVGYYNAAFKIITLLTVIPMSFTAVTYPFYAELHSGNKDKLKSVLEVSARYMLIISIPMSVGTILIARKLILTLYTVEFLPAAMLLQMLIISSLFSFANNTFYTFFAAVGKQRFSMYMSISCGVIIAVMNYLLIPQFGVTIPSISLGFVEMVLFIGSYLYLKRIGFRLSLAKMFFKPTISCIPMAVVVYLLSPLSVFIQIAAAIVAYAVSFYFIGGILSEDRIILERVLPSPIKTAILGKIEKSS